ncbi:MAG: hypothetical protein HQM16_07540 [Deltaproteobacteria bacterium]|nr:hypothetical protein [Deltaproteobacteria bacterium]
MITSVAKKIAGITDSKNLSWAVAQVLDLKGLSRDLVNALTEKALRQKDLIIDVIAKEFSKFLSKVNIAEEAHKILDGATLNVQASLNFKNQKPRTATMTFSHNGRRVTSKNRKIKK